MNSLSLLLYFAGFSSNLGSLFGFVAFAVLVVFVVKFTLGFYHVNRSRVSDNNPVKSAESQKGLVWIAILAFIMALAGLAMPSSETVLMIAASEFTQEVLINPKTQDMLGESGTLISNSLKLLNQQLEEQLAPPTK